MIKRDNQINRNGWFGNDFNRQAEPLEPPI